MRLRLMLANSAEVQNQLLYVLGAGWTEIGPEPSRFAIAAIIEIPWDETNRKHRLELTVVDGDGKPLMVQTSEGDRAVQVGADFEVGRPPGAAPGRSFTVPIAVNLTAVPFQAGQSYLVRGTIDGETVDEVQFFTRAAR